MLAACTFDTANDAIVDPGAGLPDASIFEPDATSDPNAPDADPGCVGDDFSFALLNVESCDLQESSGDLNLSDSGNYDLDTDTGSLRNPAAQSSTLAFTTLAQSDGSELFILVVDKLTIGAQTRVTVVGARPLLVVSLGDIDIEGVLAARGRANTSGAGGNLDTVCALGRGANGSKQQDDNDNEAGSGGGGGAYGAAAGQGAKVVTSEGDQSAAGQPATDNDLVPLRGGCAGGKGGDTLGGEGGYAGGAIQLTAAGTIRISGKLTASAGGGKGAGVHGGGGGGGSGGGLLVQAASLEVSGVVTANGGGGGEGSRTFVSDPGSDGRESSAQVAPGGTNASEGGDGGGGGSAEGSAVDGFEGANSGGNAAGGGGGGGSVGRIRFVSPALNVSGVVSPAAQEG